MNPDASIASLEVGAYRVPTDQPESDGTLAWDSTTFVVVHASAGGVTGLGYTYADGATARLAAHTLSDVVEGRDPMDIPAAWRAMLHAIRASQTATIDTDGRQGHGVRFGWMQGPGSIIPFTEQSPRVGRRFVFIQGREEGGHGQDGCSRQENGDSLIYPKIAQARIISLIRIVW